jgi:hypothetical protein
VRAGRGAEEASNVSGLGVVLVAAATVYGPGLAVLLALGLRQGVVLLGAAPAVSVGVAVLTACGCALFGAGFSPSSLLAGTTVVALLSLPLGWLLVGRSARLPGRAARGPGPERVGPALGRLGGRPDTRAGGWFRFASVRRRLAWGRIGGGVRPARPRTAGWGRSWSARWLAPPAELPAPSARPLLPELGLVSRAVAFAAGGALVLVAVGSALRAWYAGFGGWTTYNQDHDPILHSVLTAYIERTGRGAPWQIMPADVLTGAGTVYYPDGFHLIAATIGAVYRDPLVGMNAALAMLAGAAATTSAAALSAVAVRWLRADPAWMALAAGVGAVVAAGLYRPGAQLARDNGLLPNACALVLVPGVVAALLMIRPRAWATSAGVGLACAGVVAVHPSAGLSVGLTVGVYWLALLATRDGRAMLRAQWSALAAVLVVAAVVGAPVLRGALSVSGRIEAFPPDTAHLAIVRSLGSVLPLTYGGMFDAKGAVQVWPTLLLFTGVGTVLVLGRAIPFLVTWLAWVFVALLAFRNPAGVTAPILGFFYNSVSRVQSHTALLAPPLATLGAFGLVVALMVAARRTRLPVALGTRWSGPHARIGPLGPRAAGAVGVLALLLATLAYLAGPTGKYLSTTAAALAQRWSQPQLYRVDAEDIEAANWLKTRVKPGQRIMNSPNDGSTYLYVHDDLPVVNISTLGVPGFPYTWDLMRGFRYLDVDPRIRDEVLALNIAWVYVDYRAPIIGADGAPGNWTGGGVLTTVPGLDRLDDTRGLILAHVVGSVRVYQVDLDALRRMGPADRGP